MNLDAMKELLAAVDVGEWDAEAFANSGPAFTDLTWKAFNGDMNAALALHGALLPRWRWALQQHHYEPWVFATVYMVRHAEDDLDEEGCAPTPARALLIATLRGKIAEMERTTT